MHRVHALLNTLRLETVIRPTKAWDGFYDTLNTYLLSRVVRPSDAEINYLVSSSMTPYLTANLLTELY